MSRRTKTSCSELRATFKVEAAEHLQAIAGGLMRLEKRTGRRRRSSR